MLNVLVTLALSTAAMAAPLKPIRGSALYPSASSHEDAKANMAHKHRLSGKQADAFQQLKEMDLREQVAPAEPAKRARLIVGVQRKDISDIASQLVHQASVDEANSWRSWSQRTAEAGAGSDFAAAIVRASRSARARACTSEELRPSLSRRLLRAAELRPEASKWPSKRQ